jgi:hypothetical protein
MKKIILTPKRAKEIQSEIFSRMSSEKKIRLASQLFMLTKKLKESKNASNDPRGTAGKNS